MKRIIQDYLTFNKADRNGIILLLCFIFSLLLFFSLMEHFAPKETVDFSDFEASMQELEQRQAHLKKERENFKKLPVSTNSQDEITTAPSQNKSLSPFNPNHASKEQWLAAGLNEKQIRTLYNFESKGGSFRTKDDLKKIYGISASLFESIEPFLQLPRNEDKLEGKSKSKFQEYFSGKKVRKSNEVVELNSSDTSILVQVKGIGPVFARRIIKYRERLGGFVSIQQLHEVWGMDSSVVSAISPQLKIDPNNIRKIPINHCTVSDLKRHPYMTYNVANNIVQYRDRHGSFANLEQIKLAVLVNEELFRKIAPYLTLE